VSSAHRKISAGLAKATRTIVTIVVALYMSVFVGNGVAHAIDVGFNLKNLSNEAWTLKSVTSGTIDDGPRVGSKLFPTQAFDFSMTYWFAKQTSYRTTWVSEPSGLSADITFTLDITGSPSVSCAPQYCNVDSKLNTKDLVITGPKSSAETSVDASTDAATAASTANLCSQVKCSFQSLTDPGSPVRGDYAATDINAIRNTEPEKQTGTVTATSQAASSTSLKLTAATESKLLDALTVKLSAEYHVQTTTTRTLSQQVTYLVQPGRVMYFVMAPMVYRIRGNLYVEKPGGTVVVKNFPADTVAKSGSGEMWPYDLPLSSAPPPLPASGDTLTNYRTAQNAKYGSGK
jgi:hypothetical protein